MLLKEAIDYVSYFMDKNKADGAFAEAWSIIYKELAEDQKSLTDKLNCTITTNVQWLCSVCGLVPVNKCPQCGLNEDLL